MLVSRPSLAAAASLIICGSTSSFRLSFFLKKNSQYSYTFQRHRLVPSTTLPSSSFLRMSSDAATTYSESLDEATLNQIASNLESVRQRMQQSCQGCSRSVENVRLVAVSKTKPVPLLRAAYDANQRVFGENYVQELISKIPLLPQDVHWHFIGALQSNKAKLLVQAFTETSISRLTVETVSSIKLADKLNKAVEDNFNDRKDQLSVFVQINTSAEDTKSGVESGDECVELCRHVMESCPHLLLRGLMTIGAPNDDTCFDTLRLCRTQVQDALSLSDELELSMGMSGDFEAAIAKGATNIRVGSTIFGERDYSK